MQLLEWLLNLDVLRWWKVKYIYAHSDLELFDWLFEQPPVKEIDQLIMQTEKERGDLIVARQSAPDNYPWDLDEPEISPKYEYDEAIRQKTRELRRLHRQLDRETYRLLGQLPFPPPSFC